MLTTVKTMLGRYYADLQRSLNQTRYTNSGIERFFDQSFEIQQNPHQMVVDHRLTGLQIEFNGNEVYVSHELYHHGSVNISNTMESGKAIAPITQYDYRVIPTIAYLACQNHTTIDIVAPLDAPIFMRFSSEFERFHSSVATVNVINGAQVDIVEQVESRAALCMMVNYSLSAGSTLHLNTLYECNMASTTLLGRKITADVGATVNQGVLSNGAAIISDETYISTTSGVSVNVEGCVFCKDSHYHSAVTIEPMHLDYSVDINMRGVITGTGQFSHCPTVLRYAAPPGSTVSATSMNTEGKTQDEIAQFTQDIIRNIATRMESDVFEQQKERILAKGDRNART